MDDLWGSFSQPYFWVDTEIHSNSVGQFQLAFRLMKPKWMDGFSILISWILWWIDPNVKSMLVKWSKLECWECGWWDVVFPALGMFGSTGGFKWMVGSFQPRLLSLHLEIHWSELVNWPKCRGRGDLRIRRFGATHNQLITSAECL